MTTTKAVTKNYFELVEENEQLKDELVKVLQEIEDLKKKTIVLSRKTGEGEVLDIERQGDDWIVKEPKIKGKKQSNFIPNSNVQLVYNLIVENCDVKETISYRELVPQIIQKYGGMEVDVDSFSGGKWRRHEKGYFQTYFFPVKILTHLGLIHHKKNGDIIRLK